MTRELGENGWDKRSGNVAMRMNRTSHALSPLPVTTSPSVSFAGTASSLPCRPLQPSGRRLYHGGMLGPLRSMSRISLIGSESRVRPAPSSSIKVYPRHTIATNVKSRRTRSMPQIRLSLPNTRSSHTSLGIF